MQFPADELAFHFLRIDQFGRKFEQIFPGILEFLHPLASFHGIADAEFQKFGGQGGFFYAFRKFGVRKRVYDMHHR
jgi:hypothetical protein